MCAGRGPPGPYLSSTANIIICWSLINHLSISTSFCTQYRSLDQQLPRPGSQHISFQTYGQCRNGTMAPVSNRQKNATFFLAGLDLKLLERVSHRYRLSITSITDKENALLMTYLYEPSAITMKCDPDPFQCSIMLEPKSQAGSGSPNWALHATCSLCQIS